MFVYMYCDSPTNKLIACLCISASFFVFSLQTCPLLLFKGEASSHAKVSLLIHLYVLNRGILHYDVLSTTGQPQEEKHS